MRAIVLGSAAGGGFPQWNCGCPNCNAVRKGTAGYAARTQDSLAVTADGERYALVNTSPEILQQIQRTPALWPRGKRHSPIEAIVLTNGDMDHVLGLFSLREWWPLALYVTDAVRQGLEESAFLATLRRFDGQLVLRELPVQGQVKLANANGDLLGLTLRTFPLPGKVPVHFMGQKEGRAEDNIGLAFAAGSGPSLAYAAACARSDVDLRGHDVVFFDGTFFREDEMVRLALSDKVAKDMAHVPQDGPTGSLAGFQALNARKIFTHINNTNPILAPDSAERAAVLAAGWEIAHDGMEVVIGEAK